MHECPECGFVCDCDSDDMWNDVAAEDCTCCEMGNASDAYDDVLDDDPAPPSLHPAQPSQDVAGTSGESLAGLSKEGSETP